MFRLNTIKWWLWVVKRYLLPIFYWHGMLKGRLRMAIKEFLFLAAMLVVWFVANRWVLPAMGVKT